MYMPKLLCLVIYLTLSEGYVTHTYDRVKCAINDMLARNGYRDGPIMVRLAWHSSGTYSKVNGTGGSNGARMRFTPESVDLANGGLQGAIKLLEPIRSKFHITSADLFTLAGATAVEAMGGPYIPWRHGRKDANSGATSPQNGRLPDAGKNASHVREVFNRLSFSDEETVALKGAHVIGGSHLNFSGFSGPFTRNPLKFSNDYFRTLRNEKWGKVETYVKPFGIKIQFRNNNGTGPLNMLPADITLLDDPIYLKYVDKFAADQSAFYTRFASAFSRLLELGVPSLSTSYVNRLRCRRDMDMNEYDFESNVVID